MKSNAKFPQLMAALAQHFQISNASKQAPGKIRGTGTPFAMPLR